MASHYANGQLPSSALGSATVGGVVLVAQAAIAWNLMAAEAGTQGITLGGSGYRDLATQVSLYDDGRNAYSSSNQQGAAVPGTSQHGIGLAVDIELHDGGATLAWLNANASRFGFSNTVVGEDWHWSYTRGDAETSYMDGARGNATTAGGGSVPVGTAGQPGQTDSPTLATTQYDAPSGGTLYNNPDGTGWIVRYQVSPGVWIEWATNDREALKRGNYRPNRAEDYDDNVGNGTLLGYQNTTDLFDAWAAIEGLPSSVSTVAEWYEFVFLSGWGSNSEAAGDIGIQGVVLEIMGNPDISEDAIIALVQDTEYWRNTNDAENTWRDLSPAEQQARILNVARDLLIDHRRIMGTIDGQFLSLNDPALQQFAELVASGQATYGQVLQRFEDTAMEIDTSPYAQQAREVGIQAGQFDVDIENTSAALRDSLRAWGVTLPEDSIADWARRIELNESSQADFDLMLEQQASVLYPNRPEGMRTLDYAQPWLNTLSRIMEVGTPNLTDDRIQQALQSGTTTFDFQRELMQSEDWLYTENASDKLVGAFGSAASLMGFA